MQLGDSGACQSSLMQNKQYQLDEFSTMRNPPGCRLTARRVESEAGKRG